MTFIMEKQIQKKMESEMETGILEELYWGNIRAIYWGYIEIREKKMETTMLYRVGYSVYMFLSYGDQTGIEHWASSD